MYLVVVGHYIFHGLKANDSYIFWDVSTILGGAEYVLTELTYIIACIAVNCYVLITGYFCISKMEFRWNGIIKTIFATLFYSLGFLLIAYSVGKNISKQMIFDSLLPVRQEQYWFVSAYIGLMLVAPFLSRLVAVINKRQYQILLCILFLLTFEYLYGSLYGGARSILFFSFLYLIAGYIKIYGVSQKWKEHKGLIVLLIWGMFFSIATLTNMILCDKHHFQLRSSSNDCMILFLSVAVFVYFAYTEIKKHSLIVLSKLSPYVFGAYLVHDNPFFRKDLWNILIPSQYYIPIACHCLLIAMMILFIGVVVDYMRQKLFIILTVDNMIDLLTKRLPSLYA